MDKKFEKAGDLGPEEGKAFLGVDQFVDDEFIDVPVIARREECCEHARYKGQAGILQNPVEILQSFFDQAIGRFLASSSRIVPAMPFWAMQAMNAAMNWPVRSFSRLFRPMLLSK